MNSLYFLVFLISIAIILVSIAVKLRFSYPIILVIGGCVLGFFPGLQQPITFDPNLILFIVLPPILYYGAYSLPYKEFFRNLPEILLLALGLVITTTIVIGLIFHWLFPELPLALAFIFGAIISPPDAILAIALMNKFSVNSRLKAILEGESLINDAAGLVLYKLAIIALLSQNFSLSYSNTEFIKITIGGFLLGIVSGLILHYFSSKFFESILAVVYSFTIPYLTFFLADAMGISGVIAVVVSGLIGSKMILTHFSPLTRVVGEACWDIFIIFLNCFIFILIGMQLHGIVERVTIEKAFLYFGYGCLFTFALIVIRFIWVYSSYSFSYFKSPDQKNRHLILKQAFVISWSSMRGIVSLTLALGLPYTLLNGNAFPGRDIVILITFVVILLTLLLPGLTLSKIITGLKLTLNEESHIKEIRKKLAKRAQEELQRLHQSHHLNEQEFSFILNYFTSLYKMLEITSKPHIGSHMIEVARLQVLQRNRQYLLHLWEDGEMSDSVFKLLKHEIDLEEASLIKAQI